MLDHGVSFGVGGDADDTDDMGSSKDSSLFVNVEDSERTESAIVAGCWAGGGFWVPSNETIIGGRGKRSGGGGEETSIVRDRRDRDRTILINKIIHRPAHHGTNRL